MIVDVGWVVVGVVLFGVFFVVFVIFFVVFINVVMIFVKMMNVFNVDIWNFIYFLVLGMLVYVLMNNVWIGLGVVLVFLVIDFIVVQYIVLKW